MAEKRFTCGVCKKDFKWASGLSVHKRLHSGQKPFKCKICGKSFTRQHHLVDHGKVHSGKKPYQCKVCSKSFANSSSLRYHNLIHTDEKPYKCDLCDKAFNHPSHLTHHRRSHTNEKPYKCEICDKTFGHPSHLGQHRKIHSGKKSYKQELRKALGRSRNTLLRNKSSGVGLKKTEHLNTNSFDQKRLNHAKTALLKLEIQISRGNGKLDLAKVEDISKAGKKLVDYNYPLSSYDPPALELVQKKESDVLSPKTGSFFSSKCTASLSSKEGLEQHSWEQFTDRKLKCNQCKMNFDCPRKYDLHLLYHDLNATEPTACSYICFKCNESFDLIRKFVDHINTKHEHEINKPHHVQDITEILEPAHNFAKIYETSKEDNVNHLVL